MKYFKRLSTRYKIIDFGCANGELLYFLEKITSPFINRGRSKFKVIQKAKKNVKSA